MNSYAEKQQAGCAAMKSTERDVSPIKSEIRLASDVLDLLHMRIHSLAERLGPVLIQRGAEAACGNGAGQPMAMKTEIGRDIESITDRIKDASEKLDDVLSCLHL